MNVNINIKHKLIVNGKEYGSLDELPQDLRQAYERALAAKGPAMAAQAKIVFQGKEYASAEEMPEDLRQLYRLAIAAATRDASLPGQAKVLGDNAIQPAGSQASFSLSVSRDNVSADNKTHGFSVQLKLGKGFMLVILALLLFIIWHNLSGTGSHIP